jgi:hypothetical protein
VAVWSGVGAVFCSFAAASPPFGSVTFLFLASGASVEVGGVDDDDNNEDADDDEDGVSSTKASERRYTTFTLCSVQGTDWYPTHRSQPTNPKQGR